ncbi:hypothetical protein E2C01_026909 [Portunus trituberculatus]|uniref:Uncharacterized protein n=1 Tax=Portunus trituberculatus TaxID=210409 RepID=A0A5B7EMB7_PORTR|nr:hypothetical protein [Portunus trituberculatus]
MCGLKRTYRNAITRNRFHEGRPQLTCLFPEHGQHERLLVRVCVAEQCDYVAESSQEDYSFGIWEPLPRVDALPNLGPWPGFEPVCLRTLGPTKRARSRCTTAAPYKRLSSTRMHSSSTALSYPSTSFPHKARQSGVAFLN